MDSISIRKAFEVAYKQATGNNVGTFDVPEDSYISASIQQKFEHFKASGDWRQSDDLDDAPKYARRLISELRERIEELEAQEPVAWANPEDLVQDGYSHSFGVSSEQYIGRVPLYAAPVAKQEVDVDTLAQFIREIDGNHTMGAGALAERIAERLNGGKTNE